MEIYGGKGRCVLGVCIHTTYNLSKGGGGGRERNMGKDEGGRAESTSPCHILLLDGDVKGLGGIVTTTVQYNIVSLSN